MDFLLITWKNKYAAGQQEKSEKFLEIWNITLKK